MEKSRRLHGYLVLAQLAFAGFQILSRIALANGVHALAFTFYRNCLASLLLGAISYFTEREKKSLPSLRTLLYVFGLGFIGVTVNQVCYLTGLKHTSAIFASAMRNSTPVFTFVIAALAKVEKIDLRRREGLFKVFGALLGLCGSLILSLYRGPVLIKSNISISGTTTSQVDAGSNSREIPDHMSWKTGAVFISISCAAFGVFLILQAPVLEEHPAPVFFAAFTCLSSVVQVPLLNIVFGHEWRSWKPTSPSQVIAISYAGLIGSGLVSFIQSWGVLTQGPVVVAAYQPLETIFTALFSMIFLKEDLHLGSCVGGVIVITGLYLLVLGQQIAERESLLRLPQTATEDSSNLYLTNPGLRRHYSCDLERINHDSSEKISAQQRRHSLTVFSDLMQNQQGSSRFQISFKRPAGWSDDNQQLLPEARERSTNEV